MPPKEAMATGLPVIMTNWSGLADISDSQYNYPIDPISIDFPEDQTRVNEQPGVQARLDPAEIMFWMRYVYEHQDEAMEKGKKASEWMHRDYNWDQCAKELLEIIKKYE
jgi:glycosyltransferase involved in cell wall biosynthesis